MDGQASPHPTPETLRAYALRELDGTSAEVVRDHLERCSDCRRQVSEIEPDSFADRLRQAAEGSEIPAIDRPLAATPQTESPVADGVTVDSSDRPCMSETGPVGATSAPQNSPTVSSLPAGTLVGYFGDYELQSVLGEGGMGIVYRARQLSLNRPVALKMIKAARFAGAEEVRRFQNESEAVAQLDHPNIVPIFEVGRLEDQHYFSMKLISGESLDKRPRDYLANPRQAAELVAITAGAVHHAHQRGILHRDLKPANILIDPDGRPHVTDFGLAKRVEGDSELTGSGAILGTPAYMAPEQASGKRGAVTTATDVYGLGAVLYVLLTGKAPFSGDSVIDTLEQVRERPPEAPSKRNARVPRNLEVICLKCLEKDPRRRYGSADALAEDLRRWRAGEPIAARPVSNAARLWMWSRRNPVVAGAIGLAAAAVVAIIAAMVVEGARREEEIARVAAEADFDLAQQAVVEYLTNVSENTLLREQDSVDIRSLRDNLLKSALTFYERFAAKRKDDPRLREQLAAAYFRVGQITREIGSPTQAMGAFRSALAIWRPLVDANPKELELAGSLAECYLAMGKLELTGEDFNLALELLGHARTTLERLVTENADEPRYESSLADCYSHIGIAQSKLGKVKESLAIHAEARAIQEDLIDRYPENLAYKTGLTENLSATGFAYYKRPDIEAALKTFHEVRDICRRLMKEAAFGPKPSWLLDMLAFTLSNIGNIHKQRGEIEIALPFFEESVKYRADLADQHPSVTKYRAKLAVSYKEIADLEHGAHQDDKAIASIKKAIEVYTDLVRSQPETVSFQDDLAWCWDELGVRLDEARNNAEAMQAFDRAVAMERAAIKKTKSADAYNLRLCYYLDNLGEQSVDLGRPAEGLRHYEEAIRIRRELSRTNRGNRQYLIELVQALVALGNIERHMGDAEAALRFFADARKALEAALTATPGDPALEFQLAVAFAHEADSLADRAQAEQAKTLLQDAASRFRKLASRAAPADEPLLEREKRSETLWNLGRVLRDLKLPAEADRVDGERVDLWKAQPIEELVDLALKHLTRATLVGYGKTPLSAQARAVRQLDLDQAAGEVKMAVERGLQDLDKLEAVPEWRLLFSREDVQSAIKHLQSPGPLTN